MLVVNATTSRLHVGKLAVVRSQLGADGEAALRFEFRVAHPHLVNDGVLAVGVRTV
ncbi:MAG: hypothetical protein WCL16_08080 [bacterium]